MSVTAQKTTSIVVTGEGYNSLNGPAWSGQSASNAAAAYPSSAALPSGGASDVTVTVPSGFTVNGVVCVAPSGSTNVKSIKAISGDSNPGNWTSQQIDYPLGGMSSFVIHTAGSAAESIKLLWY